VSSNSADRSITPVNESTMSVMDSGGVRRGAARWMAETSARADVSQALRSDAERSPRGLAVLVEGMGNLR